MIRSHEDQTLISAERLSYNKSTHFLEKVQGAWALLAEGGEPAGCGMTRVPPTGAASGVSPRSIRRRALPQTNVARTIAVTNIASFMIFRPHSPAEELPRLTSMAAMTGAPEIPMAEPDVEVEHDLGWVVATDTGGDVNVIIHNDDVTPMDFVTVVLRTVFGVGALKAEGIMLAAHFRGKAYVCTLPRETAKDRVGRAHGLARQAGYPLTFSIEDGA